MLFEFDERCGAHLGDRFHKYDFNADFREAIPAKFENAFDVVVLDPPYVSRDCVEAFWAFGRWLAASDAPTAVFLTSVVNRSWLPELGGLRLTAFDLVFTSKLATPLRAFTNADAVAASLGGYVEDSDDSDG